MHVACVMRATSSAVKHNRALCGMRLKSSRAGLGKKAIINNHNKRTFSFPVGIMGLHFARGIGETQ